MKRVIVLIIMITLAFSASACGKSDKETVFSEKNAVCSEFAGLGVEWGVYEETGKLAVGALERITAAADRLNPRLVRCMTNFDWIVYDFDNKGTEDLSDDEWKYDFDNKYMINACDILDYCENKGISVAFGIWNVIGNVDAEKDEWKMIPNATSDIRWAKMTADLMEYLVKIKGYTCIKWFVNSNEPNYSGAVGASKNAYNTYAKWEQGVKNVRAALDAVGLKNIDIVGGDTTGFIGSVEYLPKIASNISDKVNNYGIHMYISNYDIDNAVYMSNMKKLVEGVKDIDGKLGESKPFIIWEAGLLDGKNAVTDCNAYIANYSYGLRMADYTVQSILAGVTGISYWDFDDAMHFMYGENGMTAKEWGMFSTLASASPLMQEYRPWFHSSVILTNLIEEGSAVYAADSENENFRTLAVVSGNGKNGGIVAVNRGREAVKKTFRIERAIESDGVLYVYVFNERDLRLGADGFVVPNLIIEGDLNEKTEIEVPAGSMVAVSTKML